MLRVPAPARQKKGARCGHRERIFGVLYTAGGDLSNFAVSPELEVCDARRRPGSGTAIRKPDD